MSWHPLRVFSAAAVLSALIPPPPPPPPKTITLTPRLPHSLINNTKTLKHNPGTFLHKLRCSSTCRATQLSMYLTSLLFCNSEEAYFSVEKDPRNSPSKQYYPKTPKKAPAQEQMEALVFKVQCWRDHIWKIQDILTK